MPALSHHSDRFRLINLTFSANGKGPYLIRQIGYPPGAMTMQDQRYFLLKDGSWLLNYAFYLLDEKEQAKHFLATLTEVFDAIDGLAGKPVVADDRLPDGTTPESIMAAVRQTGGRLIQRLQEAKAGRIERP